MANLGFNPSQGQFTKRRKPKTPNFVIEGLVNQKEPLVLPLGDLAASPSQAGEDENGFDVPILGDVLRLIDKPRAGIVSGIKEIGDIFDSDNSFSVGEWWNQTNDNIMMGEVLRDWDVDLPGPLDFVVGLGLDIALDPLTYMAGAGLAARAAKADDVVKALQGAAKATTNASKAAELTAAADRVRKTRSVLSAGDNLADIGISTGMRFTIPGTGKLGRRVIERPLRRLAPNSKVGKWLDAKRVDQLAQVNVGPGGSYRWIKGERLFDLNNPKARKLIASRLAQLRKMNKQAAKIPSGSPSARAAQVAAGMAVEIPLLRIPGLGKAASVAFVASLPGKMLGAAAKTKIGQSMGDVLSSRSEINRMIRSDDPAAVEAGLYLSRITNQATVKSMRWENQRMLGLRSLSKNASKEGIDFDVLMRAAEEPPGSAFLGAIDPRFVDDEAWAAAHADAQAWWQEAGEAFNTELSLSQLPLIKDEYYVARYLNAEGSRYVNSNDDVFDFATAEGLAGSSLKARKYATPAGMRRLREAGEITDRNVVDSLGLQQGDNIDEAFELALDEGVEITLENGNKVSNRYFGGPLQNVDEAGSVLTQMENMGKEAMGADGWKTFFSDDARAGIARYLGTMTKHIRSQAVVDGMRDAGVVIQGVNGRIQRRMGEGVWDTIHRAQRAQQRSGDKLDDARRQATRYASDVENYTKTPAELGLRGSAAEMTEQLAETEFPRLQTGGGTVKSQVSRQVEEAGVIEQMSEIQGLVDDVAEAVAALETGNAANLSAAARELLKGMELKTPTPALKKALKNRETATSALEQASERVHVLGSEISDIRRLQSTIKAVIAQSGDPAVFGEVQAALNSLDEQLRMLEEGLRETNQRLVRNILDNDPTAQAAEALAQLADVHTVEQLDMFGVQWKELLDSDPLFRHYIDEVGKLKRLELEVGYAAKTKISEFMNAAGEVTPKIRAEFDAKLVELAAKRAALEEQIAKGLGSPNAINKSKARLKYEELLEQEAVLKAQFEELETDQLLPLQAEIQSKLATITAKQSATAQEIMELQFDIIEQQRIILEGMADIDAIVAPGGLARGLEATETQLEAINLLNSDRTGRGLNAVGFYFDDAVNDYLMNMTGLGRSLNRTKISDKSRNLLSGLSLPGSVSDESLELFVDAMQAAAKTQDVQAMRLFGRRYSKFVNWWKAQAVSTPGFILRNMYGGMWVNNQINGVPMSYHRRVSEIRRQVRKVSDERGIDEVAALDEIIGSGKSLKLRGLKESVSNYEMRMFKQWFEAGLGEGGQAASEVVSAVDSAGFGSGRGFRGRTVGGTWNPLQAEFKPFAFVRSVNTDAEFMMRGALAHHAMMSGSTLDDAWFQVRKYHFDYSDLTKGDVRIKQFVPFWTWQKNILPVLVESIGKKPAAWNRISQVKGELEIHSPVEGLVPDYFAENMGVRLPFTSSGYRMYALPDLPFKDLSKYLKDFPSATVPPRAIVENIMPFYKLPIEMWALKKSFADIKMTGRYGEVPATWNFAMPVLGSLGLAKKNSKGQWAMKDTYAYAVEQFMPVLGRSRKVLPSEKDKQDRWLTTFFSTFLGLGLRTNDPSSQRSKLYKMREEFSKDIQDFRDIEGVGSE